MKTAVILNWGGGSDLFRSEGIVVFHRREG